MYCVLLLFLFVRHVFLMLFSRLADSETEATVKEKRAGVHYAIPGHGVYKRY